MVFRRQSRELSAARRKPAGTGMAITGNAPTTTGIRLSDGRGLDGEDIGSGVSRFSTKRESRRYWKQRHDWNLSNFRAPLSRGFSYAAPPNALREAVGRGAAPPSPRLRARGRVQRPRPLDPSRRPCAVSNIPRAPGLVGEPSAARPIENRAAPSHSRRRGAAHGKPPSSGRLLTSPALLENPGLRPRPSASSPRLRRLEA